MSWSGLGPAVNGTMLPRRLANAVAIFGILSSARQINALSLPTRAGSCRYHRQSATPSSIHWNVPLVGAFVGQTAIRTVPNTPQGIPPRNWGTALMVKSDDDADTEQKSGTVIESDQIVLGVAGTAAALITMYSESVLFNTGCGLPAGPFGLVGAAEGLSYLGVTAMAAYSLYTKVKTGEGLPAGPGGILGAAEGLSYLAILAGLAVLAFQIIHYGYIPNAVPVEGGICS